MCVCAIAFTTATAASILYLFGFQVDVVLLQLEFIGREKAVCCEWMNI